MLLQPHLQPDQRRPVHVLQLHALRQRLLKTQMEDVISREDNQGCGSGMFIPGPGSDFFTTRIRIISILDPGSASKKLSILTQKCFLSARNYDPDYSFRIPDPDPDFFIHTGTRIQMWADMPSGCFAEGGHQMEAVISRRITYQHQMKLDPDPDPYL